MAEHQLVVFKLNKEEYGVEIMQVQEISPYQDATKVPNAPTFVDGIINLRGEVIPVINLKRQFNIAETEITEETRLIVVNSGSRRIGFVVDDASEVVTMADENIEDVPPMIVGDNKKYLKGIGKIENRILIILDLRQLFTVEEEGQLDNIK